MIKRLILSFALFFVLFFVGGIALFPKQALLFLIEWKTNHYCQEAFGAKLELDSVIWEEGSIKLMGGRLQKSGELEALFEKAVLKPSFNLKKRIFGGTLTLSGLKVSHQKKELRPICNLPSHSSFFTLKLDTIIENGELHLFDLLHKNRVSQEATFNLNHQIFGKKSSGAITFNLNRGTQGLVTCFETDGLGGLELKTELNGQSFASLSQLVTYFFQYYVPEKVFQWDILSGSVHGALNLYFLKGELLKIYGKVDLDKVLGENLPHKLSAEALKIGCDLDMNFSSLASINGTFDLNGGRFVLHENNLWQDLWDLKNVHSKISIKEGRLETSSLKGDLMGMRGEMVFDGNAREILMHTRFCGSSKEMLALMPEAFQKGFSIAFPDDDFALNASLKRSIKGLELKGILSITDAQEIPYHFDFGCVLGSSELLSEDAIPAYAHTADFSFSRSVDSLLDNLKNQFYLFHKRFGWVLGKNIPFEKFISPFLLRDVSMQLSGLADFNATFDESFLTLFYETHRLSLESPGFSIETSALAETAAVHYFDLKTGHHVGCLPLKEANYWQKNFDFHLENTDALVHFENNQIRIKNIVTQAEGLGLHGHVNLVLHAKDDVEMKLGIDKATGSAGSAQKFLSHFTPSFFWQLPIEGTIEGKEECLFFHYRFHTGASLIKGEVGCDLLLNFDHPLGSIKDYQTHLHYDHLHKNLSFKDGCGKVFLTKNEKQLELSDCELSVTELPDYLFDLAFNVKAEGEDHPYSVKGMSSRNQEEKAITLSSCDAEGKEIFALSGRQSGGILIIPECVCNDWKGRAELNFDKNEIAITEFYCASDQKMALAFAGNYHFEEKTLSGNIIHLAANLASPFEKSLSQWRPKGTITGSGPLVWQVGKRVDANATISFHNLEFGGIYFGSGDELSCCYSSDEGLIVEGLQVEVPSGGASEKYKLGRFHYDIDKQKILFDGFDFSLPPEKLPWVAKTASELFPEKFHPVMLDWLEALKRNEPLDGRISIDADPDNLGIHLMLKDGAYFLADQKVEVKNFHLDYDPRTLNIRSEILYQGHYYQSHLVTDSKTMREGHLSLSETQNIKDALTAAWEKKGENSWSINKIDGSFCGIVAALKSTSDLSLPFLSMNGTLSVNPEQLLPLLKGSAKEVVQDLGLAGTFVLNGHLMLDMRELMDTAFTGKLSATNLKVKNVAFDTLNTALVWQKNILQLSDLSIHDRAGTLAVNQFKLFQDQGWHFLADQLSVSDLRFSRIKSPWAQLRPKNKSFFRSLLIPTFVVENFSGDLHDPKSVMGRGKIQFATVSKRTFLSSLLYVPTEITARIGLDMSNLFPAQGIIDYEVRGGKIYLNKFREMYSEGKRSRFYLARGSEAYIDFKGNMNLKVRMKQYTLLLKLADLLTISVKGTLMHPSYTLSNHADDEESS